MNDTPRIPHLGERYYYAREGTRVLKCNQQAIKATTRKQQTRYLPGLEIRITLTDSKSIEGLQVIALSGVRVLRWLAGQPAGTGKLHVRHSSGDRTDSRTLELDNNGKVISREAFYPFGGTALWATRNQIEANYKTHRYSGKERDITGLVYYGFRYYAPWLRRWFNPDPAGTVDGLNLYCMVNNNPSSARDVNGLTRSVYSRRNQVTSSLIDYQRFAERQNLRQAVPSEKMLLWDLKNIPLLVAAENQKNPALHLHYVHSVEEISDYININLWRGHQRFITPVNTEMHHLFVDVNKNENGVQVLGLESTKYYNVEDSLKKLHDSIDVQSSVKTAVMSMQVQSTEYDCVIFSAYAAGQSYRHQEPLEEIFEKFDIYNTGEGVASSYKMFKLTSQIDPLLPLDFYLHTQSRKRLNGLFRNLSAARIYQPRPLSLWPDAISSREIKSRLSNWQLENQLQIKKGSSIKYNASINQERISMLNRHTSLR
ncbi:MAG: RHS repeat-associated core domain-containing protein [Rouxiella aceris]|uniref:YopJ family acetyltransferase n=1 Tax=Rouxiella aceris TaxID=2703884 RepID=UPI0028505ECB|nr:RHS repeat-associated core domain-containing protein [Rouxiella aceris]MDR3431614.1 RHS repeat-associated core domain-containing protein [Rouxiella aceris]